MNPPRQAATRQGIRAGTLSLAATVILAAVLYTAWEIDAGRRDALARGEQYARVTAAALAAHSSSAMFDATSPMHSALHSIRKAGGLRRLDAQQVHEILESTTPPGTALERLTLHDRAGNLLATSIGTLGSGADLHGSETVREHLEGGTGERVLIGKPTRSPLEAAWELPLTQAVHGADGRVDGVITGLLRVEYFTAFYAGLFEGNMASAALTRNDGVLLLRHPFEPRQAGKDLSAAFAELQDLARRQLPPVQTSPMDGVERLYAWRETLGFPLILVVGLETQDLLAAWRAGATQRLALTAAFVLVVLLLAALALRQMRAVDSLNVELEERVDSLSREMELRQRSQDDLRASQQRFEALFRGSPTPTSITRQDGVRLDCNDAYCRLVGRSREELVGNTLFAAGLYPDAAELERARARFRADGRLERHQIRILHASGSPRDVLVWIEQIDWGGVPAGLVQMIDISERQRAEEAMRQSEARFRQVFDNATEAIWLVAVQPDGRLEYAMLNDAICRLSGMKAERVIGKTPHEAHPGRFDDYVEGRWRACLEAGVPLHYEESYPMPTGTRHLNTSLAPVRGEDGSVRFIVGIAHDITERKRAEEALRVSEARFRGLTELSSDWYWEQDAQLRFTRFSGGQAHAKWGGDQSLNIGRLRWEIPGLVPLSGSWDEHRALLEARQPFRDFEYLRVLEDGSRRYVAASGEPQFDAAGAFTGYCGTASDVTEQRRSQEALRESEQRFSALFHNSLVPQAVTNLQSRLAEDVNQAILTMTGYSREQFLRQPGSEFGLYWSDDDLQKVGTILRQGGTTEPVEVRLRRADGRQCTTLVTATTLHTSTGARIAWSLVDITEQRAAQREVEELNDSLERTVAWRTEELSRANEELKGALEHLKTSQDALLQSEKLAALGRLVAGVAHELNTPIGNSLLSASTLAHHTEDFARESARGDLRRSALQAFVAQSKEAAGILVRNLEKAAELIRSFKQVAADQTSSQRRSFALKEVVDEVLLAHRPMLRKSPIRAETDVPEGIRLDSYPGPLGQVLGNLITNAVLHGYDGASSGTVTILARPSGDDGVEIAVIDEGRGIPEGDLKRIFDPFFTTKLGRGGTGLGLGICHRIVTEALGGSIHVQSIPAKGSSFHVHLPLSAPVASVQKAA